MAGQPIVIKRKAAHAGHHGGAWKVAYADFVTAMMALFIVLWLVNSSKPIKDAVGGYFRDPKGTASKAGSNLSGTGENLNLAKQDMPKLKEQLESAIRRAVELEKLKQQIDMTVTSEGLRIELLESDVGTFFESGNSHPTPKCKELLQILAQQLGKLPNKVSIEGHTDSRAFADGTTYGNWELSADRANAARHLMQEDGLAANQVSQVRGFADQRLRKPEAPFDSSNRRVSLIVQYLPVTNLEEPPAAPATAKPGEKSSPSPPATAKPEEKSSPSPEHH
jgi:chemotaxis protein MotB